MAKVVIGINGPRLSGKTWFTAELLSRLKSDPYVSVTHPRIERFEMGRFIWQTGVQNGAIKNPQNLDYRQFKGLDGGRQEIIDFSVQARKGNPTIFDKAICDSGLFQKCSLAIVDNFGISEEPIYFAGHCQFLATLRIDFPFNPDRKYDFTKRPPIGEFWTGDCRMPLPATNGWAAADSQEMYEMTDAVLTYAITSQSPGGRLSKTQVDYTSGIGYAVLSAWRHHIVGPVSR